MMLRFDYPWLLVLAVILPAVIVALVLQSYRGRRARLERLGTLDVVMRLVPVAILRRPGWRIARLATAGALAGIAVAGPRWGEGREVVQSRGIDLVLSLDASLSMLATDERPNRLERMKEEVRRLRAMSPGDRVALLAFAGRSYILTPLTVDQGALDLYLDNLNPSVVGEAGTSLAHAIQQGVDLLSLSNSGADKALVLMSDGEELDGTMEDITAEARRAREQGVALVTVGFGTTEGSPIPVRDGDVTTLKQYEGQTVITKYHPEFLKAAADAAGGSFIEASATDKAGKVKSALSTLRSQSRASSGAEEGILRYQWFLFPALLLLLWDTVLTERDRRRLRPTAVKTVAALVAVSALSGCIRFTTYPDAVNAYHRGDFPRSAALFNAAVMGGDHDPTTSYDLGTALVGADSLQAATQLLDRLGAARDPELRYRADFNLGLAQLKSGLAQAGDAGRTALDGALAAYKKVLLMRPGDFDAKWNYELALKRRQQNGGGGGGGGGQSQSNPPQAPQPTGGMGQRQADQLLGSAAREERDTQAKKQKQNHAETPPGGKDW